jgi:hypothetical protein
MSELAAGEGAGGGNNSGRFGAGPGDKAGKTFPIVDWPMMATLPIQYRNACEQVGGL